MHEMDQSLDDGVVGSVHMDIKGKGAFTVTEIGRISIRRDYPLLQRRKK